MHKRKFISAVAALALCHLPTLASAEMSAEGPTLSRIKATKSIVLAVRETSAPFSYNNGHDQFIGYSVEMCELIAKGIQADLGIPEMEIAYVPVTGSERVDVIKKDYADLECSTTSITRKRLESVEFSVATFYSTSVFVGRKGASVRGAQDLGGKRVAVGDKTIQETFLKGLIERGSKITVEGYKNPNDAFLALLSGRVDFFATDDLQALSMMSGSDDAKAKMSIMDMRFLPNTYGIMLKKADPAFKDAVNRQLKTQFANGAARNIYKKWFETPIHPTGKSLDWGIPKQLDELFTTPSDAALID